MKKVLITGANSYIGTSFERYAKENYPNELSIDTVDMKDGSWRNKDFSNYDIVYHVAGIAHADVGKVDEETKRKYYEINTKLAIKTAKKAKKEGVKQFVFMSSMIVYGKQSYITPTTNPRPGNFYGDSKWRADKGVRRLADDNFIVTVLRPPMIYGRGSKGNYPTLAKMAKRLPVFPDIKNERSMLYIENLCEFLCQVMIRGEGGIFWPQNAEYSSTTELVRMIAKAHNHKICISKLWNILVMSAVMMPGKPRALANKAFGSMSYEQGMSECEFQYQQVDLGKSIERTEANNKKKKVLFLVNHDVVIYNFRLELVERLINEGYEVHISTPIGDHTSELKSLGAHIHEISFDRHGMNPSDELKIIRCYIKLMKNIRPSIVLTYTIKCNIYGGIASKIFNIPFCANITGLGTAIGGGGKKEEVILKLYRIGLKGAQKVFFQNKSNRDYMVKKGLVSSPYTVLPGSGVNLKRHCYEPYPTEDDAIIISYIGRIMKDKGIDELLEAAIKIKRKFPKVCFRLIGFFDDEYEDRIKQVVSQGIIEYIPQQRDIHPWIAKSHAIIMPSYHEGMNNVLLEAAATGRPVLASKIAGCEETFVEGVSGLGFEPHSSKSIVASVRKFMKLSFDEKETMGKNGREKMIREFDRSIVVDEYMKEVKNSKEKYEVA